MSEISTPRKKRKLLKLKTSEPEYKFGPIYVEKPHDVYMVWRPGGEMPKRVYPHAEQELALTHAKQLASEFGERMYVMRAWRAFDPEEASDA